MGAAFDELVLKHYGVPGMKWGVRQDRGHEGERVKNKKLPKLDKKWEKQFNGTHGFIKIHNAVADKMNNGRIDKVNNKPEFKNVNMWDPANKKIADRYFKEIGDQQLSALHEVARDLGTNPSGTKRMQVTVDKASGEVHMKLADIQHADDDFDAFEWVGKLNAKGQVTTITQLEEDDFLEQMDDVADFLAHYGVVGMKWGRRRSGLVKEGASADATKVNEIHSRVKAHKSTRPLSNKELQDAITRMNLEQQYSKLSGGLDKTRRQKTADFISKLITDSGKQAVTQVVGNEVKGQVQAQVNAQKARAAA